LIGPHSGMALVPCGHDSFRSVFIDTAVQPYLSHKSPQGFISVSLKN